MSVKSSRKSRSKKGQSAVEYLASNAWIIVIAIVGIIVLWQMGVFAPPTPKRGSIGFSQLTPLDWIVSIQDVSYLRIRNDAGAPVKILPGGMSLNVYQVPCNSSRTPQSEVTLNPGSSKIFVFYCSGPVKISDNFNVGDYYEGDVTIDYINLFSGSKHTSVGKIFGPIEGRIPFGGPTTTTLPGNCGQDCTQPGVLNATECIEPPPMPCPYCDLYDYKCVPGGSCGNPCTEGTATTDCTETCLWCNTTTLTCQQGDCGKPCTNNAECYYGCNWCNPATGVCSESSSCGDPCEEAFGGMIDPFECEVECQFCYDYIFECVNQGDCGQPCVLNEDCPDICCYCSKTSNSCEQGDCGKTCTEDNECTRGCTKCIGGRCRGCVVEPWPSSTTVTSSSTSSSSTSTTAGGYIIAGQVYPKNGSIG